MSIIDRLKNRRTIFLGKPLVSYLTQLYVGGTVGYVDSESEALIEAKRREWTARGVSKNLQDMAVELAREWTESMARFYASVLEDVIPGEDVKHVSERIAKRLLRKALDEVAENWIAKMSE